MTVYLIILGYLGFTFWGSLWGATKKEATPESYFLANRSLTTLGLFFTILATNFSAFYFLGFAGEGYKIGFIHYLMMAMGTAFASISFFIIGIPAWRLGKENGYITPTELIYGQTGSRSLAMLFSAVMIIFTLPYLALQIIGGGYILENLTGGDISYSLSVILLTIFTIVYVIIGGMESVAKTDLKQGILVILFMTLAVFWVGSELGGIQVANQRAYELVPDLFTVTGGSDSYNFKKWLSFLVFWIFCIPMFPQLFMRFYIAKDIEHLKKSALLYAFIPILISILPVLIGIWGHLSFPGLEGKASDQILPMILLEHSEEWFAAIVMTGAIAAFMSTLDSQLLALSTMLTRDFYIPLTNQKPSFKKEVFIGRVMVGILAMIGLLISFNPFDTIFDMGKMAFSGLAILFPVALFSIHRELKNSLWPILAILISIVILFGFYYGWIDKSICLGFEIFLFVIIVSFLISSLGFRKKE